MLSFASRARVPPETEEFLRGMVRLRVSAEIIVMVVVDEDKI